jgi:hypothetical protein
LRSFTPPSSGDSKVTASSFLPASSVRGPAVAVISVVWFGRPASLASCGIRPVSAR